MCVHLNHWQPPAGFLPVIYGHALVHLPSVALHYSTTESHEKTQSRILYIIDWRLLGVFVAQFPGILCYCEVCSVEDSERYLWSAVVTVQAASAITQQNQHHKQNKCKQLIRKTMNL